MGIQAMWDNAKKQRQCSEALQDNGNRRYMQIASEQNMRGGAALFLWATFPNIGEALKVMEAWGFTYKTAAFVWVKKNPKSGTNFWGMGQYTRANAEVCLLGITPGFKAGERVKSHRVHQIIEAPFEGHSRKPPEVRERIVELLGDVPRLELFARDRAKGWDSWGDELEVQD